MEFGLLPMPNIKRVILAVLLLLLILVVLVFVLENQQAISMVFLGWTGPALPVSVIVVLSLLVGMVLGPLLYWLLLRGRKVPRASAK
jgi:putative membrane protein